MKSSPSATDISGLVSDLEGLALSSKNRRQLPESSLPSLQQLYQLGLLLFRILRQKSSNRKSVDNDPVVISYRELIESIPDESLRLRFADLFRAAKMLLSSATSNNSNNNARDLSKAIYSIEGLIGAFSDYDSQSCRPTESNSRLCRLVYDSSWISTLSALYDSFIVFEKKQETKQRQKDGGLTTIEIESTKKAILSCLSRLILDGLVLADGDSSGGGRASTIEESLLEAIRCMEEESTDCLRELQEWQNREEPYRRSLEESLSAIGNSSSSADEDETLERTQQREYIVSMLESARGEPSSMALPRSANKEASSSPDYPNASGATSSKRPMPPSSSADTELDRRVQQVLQILPHFGEGFVEVALGLYKGDVEATVATLLNHPSDGNSSDSSYPTALRVLDPKLPRRKREFQAYQTAEEEAIRSEEARRDVKERMALEEKQKREQYEALVVATTSQQQEIDVPAEAAAATTSKSTTQTSKKSTSEKKLTRKELRQQKLKQMRMKDEYDDDYDDQYDEIDIKLGAADDGFTSDNNMTFQQVKLYNQVIQEDESDVAFWESNRNSNQKGGKTNSKNDNNGEKKWGPDKIKGGRVIGPDGKIVRKPGGVKKKKANNNKNNSNSNSNSNGSNNKNSDSGNSSNKNNKAQGGKPKPTNSSNSNSNSNTNNTSTGANNGNKKKPKTKPRSDNRINRQRDRKLKKQGAFGVQD